MYVFRLLYVFPDTRKKVVHHFETQNFSQLLLDMRIQYNACCDVMQRMALEGTECTLEFSFHVNNCIEEDDE